jgi:hypothetical protein
MFLNQYTSGFMLRASQSQRRIKFLAAPNSIRTARVEATAFRNVDGIGNLALQDFAFMATAWIWNRDDREKYAGIAGAAGKFKI